jgi:hypothetical protein
MKRGTCRRSHPTGNLRWPLDKLSGQEDKR